MNEAKNPWTVISRGTVYENPWIRVDHHEVLDPAGNTGIYGTAHFKMLATGTVAIDHQGNVILVGQFRFPLNSYSWEIPEGGGALNLPAIESAQRELREEAGLVAKTWLEILGVDLSNSVTDERGTAFLAWDLTEVPSEPEGTEKIEIARVPFWEAVERVKRGEIRDSISVSALLRVALMAHQGELPKPLETLICSPVKG